MSETGGGFELEDDAPVPPPRVTPAPERPPERAPAETATPDEPEVHRDETTGLDTRTVAERAGKPTIDASVALPPPPGWPLEAFQYPLRGQGPFDILAAAIVWAALDTLGALGFVVFLTWMLKPLLFFALLLGQIALIGSTASGKDEPVGWGSAIQFEDADPRSMGHYALWVLPLLLVGAGLLLFGSAALGLLLVLIGVLHAAVATMGQALGDTRLRLPWKAAEWFTRGPLHVAIGCAGWLAAWVGEIAILHQQSVGVGLTAIVGFALRLLCVYMLFVSARALGVLGRQWEA
jgi:hypothetical protein